MIKSNFFLIAVVALFAGFVGGNLSLRPTEAVSPQVIRASRFELVNPAGLLVATWDVGVGNQVHFRFLRGLGKPALDIALRADGTPIVEVFGKDQKERISLGIGAADKPRLIMSDDQWGGRVHLGYVEADTVNSTNDNWALLFRAIGSERTVAGIGLTKVGDGDVRGDIVVDGKKFP